MRNFFVLPCEMRMVWFFTFQLRCKRENFLFMLDRPFSRRRTLGGWKKWERSLPVKPSGKRKCDACRACGSKIEHFCFSFFDTKKKVNGDRFPCLVEKKGISRSSFLSCVEIEIGFCMNFVVVCSFTFG